MTTEQQANIPGQDSVDFHVFQSAGLAFEIGQTVHVYHSRVGFQGRKRQTVSKITATQVTLDDGERYMITTGGRVGAYARCDRRPSIVRVGPSPSLTVQAA